MLALIAFFRLIILGFCVKDLKISCFYVWLLKLMNIRVGMNEISGSQMKKTYNDNQCGRCGLIGHSSRGCMKQGVDRRPKDCIDTEPEEENVENAESIGGVVENAGNVSGNTENLVVENVGGVAENAENVNPGNLVAENDGQVAQNAEKCCC
jgi:hypothetical protein